MNNFVNCLTLNIMCLSYLTLSHHFVSRPMMKYLGKTHNLWHRMTLNLEQMAIDQASGRAQREPLEIYDYDVETTTPTVSIVYSWFSYLIEINKNT